VADDQYEPNRFLGFPVRTGGAGGAGAPGPAGSRGPRAKRQEEPQRVMGFPLDWPAGADLDWLDSLVHPVRAGQRWLRRRRPGPSAIDEDQPRR
jgi:hypothetical protein